jgi:hypothetical protein
MIYKKPQKIAEMYRKTAKSAEKCRYATPWPNRN